MMNIHDQDQIEVLLVEDNLDDAELTIRALRKNNNIRNLHHVKDGVEALDFVFGTGKYEGRNVENRPGMILLDINMPKIGGMEVLERIKSDDRTKMIPVVVLTSSKECPDVESCYQLGANSYIVKPVGYDNFMNVVNDLGMYWMTVSQPMR